MADPDERPSRQDAFFDSVATFLQRNAFGIALIAPVVVIGLVPMGPAGVFVVLLIYLVEAIAYSAIQRRRRGAQSGPGPGLQILSGCVATILILAGIVGLSSSSESLPTVPILAISLGIGIVAWVWHRVSRASGEDTTIVVGRVAGIVGRSGGSLVVTLVVRLIFVAAVAGVAWLIADITKLFD